MCTVFPAENVAGAKADDTASLAASFAASEKSRTIPPRPGITRSKTNRPFGPVVVSWIVLT